MKLKKNQNILKFVKILHLEKQKTVQNIKNC